MHYVLTNFTIAVFLLEFAEERRKFNIQSPVYRSLPISYIFAAVKDEIILSNKTNNGFPDFPTRMRSLLPDKKIFHFTTKINAGQPLGQFSREQLQTKACFVFPSHTAWSNSLMLLQCNSASFKSHTRLRHVDY